MNDVAENILEMAKIQSNKNFGAREYGLFTPGYQGLLTLLI